MAFKKVYTTYNSWGRYICDTVQDIQSLPGPREEKVGTRALVTEGSKRYVLAPGGWMEVSCCGGSGGGGGSYDPTTKNAGHNTITTPSWLMSATPGSYYGTIDSACEYTWPYEGEIPTGQTMPVFMEVFETADGVKMFECHSRDGEYQAIYNPSTDTKIEFSNISGEGVFTFENI